MFCDLIFLAVLRFRKWKYSCGAGWENRLLHRQAVFCLINAAKKTLSILHAGKAVCLLIPKNSLRSFCGMGESNSQPQFGKLMLYHLTNPAN